MLCDIGTHLAEVRAKSAYHDELLGMRRAYRRSEAWRPGSEAPDVLDGVRADSAVAVDEVEAPER
jgi:hypothetical protein